MAGGATFLEEVEQECDGTYKVEVDDGSPCFCLGVESGWCILKLKVTQDS